MVSRRLRCPVGSGTALFGCALVMATALLGGCTRAVDGTVRAADRDARPAEPIPLSDLLIEPRTISRPVPGGRPRPDIGGSSDPRYRRRRARRAVVTPPLCAPRAPGALAAGRRRGTGRRHRHRRAVSPSPSPVRATALTARRDQLSACPSFTAAAGERSTSRHGDRCFPPPPVDADDSLRGGSNGVQAVGRDPAVADTGGAGRRRAGDGRVDDGKRRRAAGHRITGHPVHRRACSRCAAAVSRRPSPVASSSPGRAAGRCGQRVSDGVGCHRRGMTTSQPPDFHLNRPVKPDRRAAGRARLRAGEVARSGNRRPRRNGLRYAR